MFACLQIYLYSYIYTTIHIFIFLLELAQHEVNENKRLSLSEVLYCLGEVCPPYNLTPHLPKHTIV